MKTIIFSIFLISGCYATPVQPHATPVPTGTTMCPMADQHLSELCQADPVKNKYCCETDAPTKKGKSFTQFCTEKQNEGVALNPVCLSQITSCDQIDSCTQTQ